MVLHRDSTEGSHPPLTRQLETLAESSSSRFNRRHVPEILSSAIAQFRAHVVPVTLKTVMSRVHHGYQSKVNTDIPCRSMRLSSGCAAHDSMSVSTCGLALLISGSSYPYDRRFRVFPFLILTSSPYGFPRHFAHGTEKGSQFFQVQLS